MHPPEHSPWSDYIVPEVGITRVIRTRRATAVPVGLPAKTKFPPPRQASRSSIAPPLGEDGSLYQIRIPANGERPWLRDFKDRWNIALNVQHVQPAGSPPSRLVAWIEIVFDPPDLRGILSFLETRPSEEHLRVSLTRDDRMMLYMSIPFPPAFGAILERGGLCEFAPALINGPPEAPDCWGFIVPRDGGTLNVSNLHSSYRSLGGIRGSRAGGDRSREGVSYRQEIALRTAFRLGYFENPRRADLGEVGAAMGVSAHAAMELLRRAVRELVSDREFGRYA
ncbi:MAG: helix-turn-helix domain-containing protein [Thermoplasmata archaeon]|nr:helix-turn-helix domain-containing protein [Thermoplasmata archaeon]